MLSRKGNITDVWPRIFTNTKFTIMALISSNTLHPVPGMSPQHASDWDNRNFLWKAKSPIRQKQDSLKADAQVQVASETLLSVWEGSRNASVTPET